MEPNPPRLPEEALAALAQGNKIEAIKLVRERHNLGLKEAKDLVDAYVESQPLLKAQGAANQKRSAMGCLLGLLALLAAIVAGILFFKAKAG